MQYLLNERSNIPLVYIRLFILLGGFPGGASGKESTCHCRRHKRSGLIPGLGTSPGGGNGNPLQHSCLENSMDRTAWWATVHGVTKIWTRLKWFIITWLTLSTFKCLINVKLKMNNLVACIAKASWTKNNKGTIRN